MTYDNENILTKEQIEKVISELLKDDDYYHISKVVLFGSYARGEAEGNSDIDLVIFNSPSFKGMQVYSFIGNLKMKLHKDIDLFVDRNIDTDSKFYENIIKEGISIYE